MSGILKAQAIELEKSAETLERIVYKELAGLDYLSDFELEAAESRVLSRLRKLDSIQDEIDALIAALLEQGVRFRPVANKAVPYKKPKPRPVPVPRAPTKAQLAKQVRDAKRQADQEAKKAEAHAKRQADQEAKKAEAHTKAQLALQTKRAKEADKQAEQAEQEAKKAAREARRADQEAERVAAKALREAARAVLRAEKEAATLAAKQEREAARQAARAVREAAKPVKVARVNPKELHWQSLPSGAVTRRMVAETTGVSMNHAKRLLQEWQRDGRLKYSGTSPSNERLYCRSDDKEVHEESRIIEALKDGPLSLRDLCASLGYSWSSPRVRTGLEQMAEAGHIEIIVNWPSIKYQLSNA
jgi:hypothetical protein